MQGVTDDKKDKIIKNMSHKFWNKIVHYAKDTGKTVAEIMEEVFKPIVEQKDKTERGKKNGK